jgi:hypothetical protein
MTGAERMAKHRAARRTASSRSRGGIGTVEDILGRVPTVEELGILTIEELLGGPRGGG